MNEPIDELITYADHTQDCMVAAGHDECTCGYDDAHAKMWAAWEALKAENARLAAALVIAERHLALIAETGRATVACKDAAKRARAALSAVPSDSPADSSNEQHSEVKPCSY